MSMKNKNKLLVAMGEDVEQFWEVVQIGKKIRKSIEKEFGKS